MYNLREYSVRVAGQSENLSAAPYEPVILCAEPEMLRMINLNERIYMWKGEFADSFPVCLLEQVA